MFVDITEKQFFPFSPHVIWVIIQIDVGPWHLVEITQKLVTVKVLKLPCLNRARTITVVVGLTCQENKGMITYTMVNETQFSNLLWRVCYALIDCVIRN